LGYYYNTLNAHASKVGDHHEKQKFLKVVYENFYKVYNPKGADKLGVVYTPNEIVRFMVKSTDYLLQKHFNKGMADKNVHILDPATGTGTFITDIIDYIPSQYLEHKYKHEIFANEVAILPYYVANLNIEYTYKQKMGKYLEFPNSCFVDTLDNIDGLTYEGKQISAFGFSSENAERIKRQNEQKISVIIGNPPYNANQANFNDFNKNREYKDIDKRIKETYVKMSTAQKSKVYDMYARFYRWATDRIDENGVVCMVTNNSFANSKTFDGFRKCIQDEFDFCYIIDLGGNVRELSGKNGISIGEAHTVFGLGAMVGIAVMFLVKSEEKLNNKCQIKYIHPCDIRATRVEKFEWLNSIKSFGQINFEAIIPDKNNNWINLSDNDFESLLTIIDKDAKAGKVKNSLFKFYSNGVATNRDEWVYDLDKSNLEKKSKFLSETYNSSITQQIADERIKWSRDLNNKLARNLKSKFDKKHIINAFYKPYSKKYYYSEKIFSDVLTQNHVDIFSKDLNGLNKCIGYIGKDTEIQFSTLAFENINDLNSLSNAAGGNKTMPLYIYDQEGNRHDNITDWGLSQFQEHYIPTLSKFKTSIEFPNGITKEAIFYYTYAVLHNPEYRKKYELNLKREFPRLPFYEDFFKWVSWGKQLMDLHINYETVAPFDLKVVDNTHLVKDKNYKLKVKLKADRLQGVIAIDEHTYIHGVPDSVWLYKLGNRSAIEWVLDQYKEKKYTDKTITEKFNTYRFADYKNPVIDLLKRVCTVSVETMKIIEEMEAVKNS
jgi:predicted helicase